jgi:benzoyl-CoA 2,3-epoxidase subunit B
MLTFAQQFIAGRFATDSTSVGTFKGRNVTPDGKLTDAVTWQPNVQNWLPTAEDRAHVEGLMVGVQEPGKMAGWLAPPQVGIHAKPVDYDYVKV